MMSAGLARSILVAAFAFTIAACGAAPAEESQASAVAAQDVVDPGPAPIPNFEKVRDGLYRGGHPDAEGLDYLKTIGVKTIIDLEVGDFIEAYPWSITEEMDGAADRGISLLRQPMSAFEPAVFGVLDGKIDAIMAMLSDPSQGPFYVHCLHGQDRTGLVIGLERVLIENWAPQDAHDEMVRLGFHTFFIGLDGYFTRKSGWE